MCVCDCVCLPARRVRVWNGSDLVCGSFAFQLLFKLRVKTTQLRCLGIFSLPAGFFYLGPGRSVRCRSSPGFGCRPCRGFVRRDDFGAPGNRVPMGCSRDESEGGFVCQLKEVCGG